AGKTDVPRSGCATGSFLFNSFCATMRSWVPRQIARVETVLSVGALSPGCLIAPPDTLEEPQRIPPRALVEGAQPVVTQIVQTSKDGAETEFSVDFVSDDQGEPIIGPLFLNYPNYRPTLGYAYSPPAPSESGPRNMRIFWSNYRR